MGRLPQVAENYMLANPDMEPAKVVLNLAAKDVVITEEQVDRFWSDLQAHRKTEAAGIKKRGPMALPQEAKEFALAHPDMSAMEVTEVMAKRGVKITHTQIYNLRVRMENARWRQDVKMGEQ